MRELLGEQFGRLSALEQNVVFWLAIMREPVSLEELLAVFNTPRAFSHVLEALDSLYRHNLIERGPRAGSFTLHSVVLEYATARLITEISGEIEQGKLAHLKDYGLCQTQAKGYVRQVQEQLLVVPLLTRLQSTYHTQAATEQRLLWLLRQLRGLPHNSQGYGPVNLVTLLRVQRGNLRGLDLSNLTLRGVYLQGVEMQDARLSGAHIQNSVFTEPLDAITALTISADGQYWAAASWRGEVRVWGEAGQALLRVWQAYIASVPVLAFSPDGTRLASGGGKGGGELFVWKAESGKRLASFEEKSKVASAVAWSPSGEILISGGSDGMLRWWEVLSGQCIRISQGHKGIVQALKVAPDGTRLASCGDDGTIMLWNLENGEHLKTLRRDRLYERLNITGIKGISQAQKAMLRTLGGYEEPSISQ